MGTHPFCPQGKDFTVVLSEYSYPISPIYVATVPKAFRGVSALAYDVTGLTQYTSEIKLRHTSIADMKSFSN